MPKHQIRVDLEGIDSEGGNILASAFVKTIERIINMISMVDVSTATDRKPSFYLRIVDLGLNSPPYVTFEQVLVSPEADRRELAARRFLENLARIEAEEDEGVTFAFLKQAGELSTPIGESIKTVRVSVSGRKFSVDEGFREHVAKRLAPEETASGFIRGMLDYINIHSEEPVLCVYPDIGPKRVKCLFGSSLLPVAKSGIGRFVEVRGIMKYKTAAAYPHEMAVERIEILPGDEELPTFEQLRGAFPDLTGGLPAEEYVRQTRDDADKG